VRTYRGRTIEELIPRIRAELGPDAIILREREGLMGGIGGFFAQKCVEIDAQAAPRVNVYADDFEDDYDDELEGTPEHFDGFSQEPPPGYVPVPLPDAPPPDYDAPPVTEVLTGEAEAAPALPELAPAVPEPAPAVSEPAPAVSEPAPAVPEPMLPVPEPMLAVPEPAPGAEAAIPVPPPPEAPAAAPPVPAAPFLDEASFAARLEEATFATDEIAPEPEPEPEPEPAPVPAAAAPPAFIAFDELDEGPAPEPVVVEPAPVEAEPVAVEPEPEPVAIEPEPVVHRVLDPAPWLEFAAEVPAVEEGTIAETEPEPMAEEPEAEPALAEPEPVAEEPEPVAEPALAEPEPQPQPQPEPESDPAEPEPAPSPATATAAAAAAAAVPQPSPPAPTPQYGYATRRRGGLLPAAERMLRAALDVTTAANARREREYEARLGSSEPTGVPFPRASSPVTDPDATRQEEERAQAREEQQLRDADLERRLIRAGLTPGRAAALVSTAISRRGPFSAGGSVTSDVTALIAASLPTPTHLPLERGAIAVVGAGGSGKTRSVAALAAAQAHAGALVSVASLGAPGREDELGALLHGEAVNIIPAMRTRATARAVSSARERGLVLIDTAAAAPRDDSTIDVMSEALHSFGLDGIYLAVPATLSSAAAVKLVDSFSAFDLTGMIATHVDETDGLGTIAELAMQTGIPVAYTHTGIELQKGIESADPEQIAAELLR
jgi:flagellar biosynthesis GTPase FlhF